MRTYDPWIAGDVRPFAGERLERTSPADGRPLASVALGGAAEVDAAVAAARAALPAWSALPGGERGKRLAALADAMIGALEELASLEAEESGKPIRAARGEVEYGAELVRYAGALAWNLAGRLMTDAGPDKLGLVIRQPKGVAGLILPWNYPVVCLMQKLPFALAAGCTAVVKPSELTAGTTLAIARLAAQAGLPAGAINVVTGTGAAVGDALVRHEGVDVVSFTGSTAVGRRIAAIRGERVRAVTLELGGKGANIVFADADLDAAVEGAVAGFTINKGEECCAGGRILVERAVAAPFADRLKARAEAIRLGPPLDEATEMGPIVSEGQLDRVTGYVAAGLGAGARLLTGGDRARDGDLGRGLYLRPTVFADVPPDAAIWREEIFGPVAAVMPFDGTDEAIRLANDTGYGLANGVWTRSLDRAMKVVRGLRSGTVYVNTFLETIPQLPFGGMGDSGLGRENGVEGLMEYLDTRAAFVRMDPGI